MMTKDEDAMLKFERLQMLNVCEKCLILIVDCPLETSQMPNYEINSFDNGAKLMLVVFFNCRGIVHREFITRKCSVNAD